MAFLAASLSGTRRSLLPLPRTVSMRALRSAAEIGSATPLECGLVRLIHVDARLRQQPVDFCDGEHLGQRTAAFRAFDDGGWVVGAASLRIEEAIELADGREPPRHR